MKSYYQGRLLHEQGKIKEAYEKYENVIFYGFSTLNFVLSTMAGLALRENDIPTVFCIMNVSIQLIH